MKKQNRNPALAVTILRGGATKRVRDGFLTQSIKKSSRTYAVRDDVCFRYSIDEHEVSSLRKD